MPISDRLDEIQGRAATATDLVHQYIDTGGEAHEIIVADRLLQHARTDVPWLVEQVRKRDAALRAVIDACSTYEKTQAIYRIEMGQREIIRVIRSEIAAALGEGS